MLYWLPKFLKAPLSLVFFLLNTVLLCLAIYPFILLKILVPIKEFKQACTRIIARIGEVWVTGNDFNMNLTQKFQWEVTGLENLDRNKSYLICANHQSWVDIVVLQHVFNKKIPFIRFFLKQQLIFVPFLGLAWWGLDFPFMKRYSKEYREKNPDKKNRDLEITQRACERFRNTPVSILNFLEGTRFTTKKHIDQNSPFQNLLLPKAGGLAFVISCMGEQFDALLDVTIIYPQGAKNLWQMFSGELSHFVVKVRQLQIPKQFIGRNYSDDPTFRTDFQNWVRELWLEKDLGITSHRA